jgi:hypothetical protein
MVVLKVSGKFKGKLGYVKVKGRLMLMKRESVENAEK